MKEVKHVAAGTSKQEFYNTVGERPYHIVLSLDGIVYLSTKGNRISSPHQKDANLYKGKHRSEDLLDTLLLDGFSVQFTD
jgi:hypothetical protein